MQEHKFSRWLKRQRRPNGKRWFVDRSVRNYLSNVRLVAQHYGNLDDLYRKNRFKRFLQDSSKLPVSPASLDQYKTAIRRYREFKDKRKRDFLKGKCDEMKQDIRLILQALEKRDGKLLSEVNNKLLAKEPINLLQRIEANRQIINQDEKRLREVGVVRKH